MVEKWDLIHKINFCGELKVVENEKIRDFIVLDSKVDRLDKVTTIKIVVFTTKGKKYIYKISI